jgi:hypothetical protein
MVVVSFSLVEWLQSSVSSIARPLSPSPRRRAQAQGVAVPINDEPHHKATALHQRSASVGRNPSSGQSTPPFVHEYDVATVVVGDGMLNIQRNGEPLSPGVAERARRCRHRRPYRRAPQPTGLKTNGTTEYRAFEVENMREGGWPPSQPFTAPGSSVLKESRAFTIYDVGLTAGFAGSDARSHGLDSHRAPERHVAASRHWRHRSRCGSRNPVSGSPFRAFRRTR